jgi:uncharacterized protein GlcG (DUF336 family)
MKKGLLLMAAVVMAVTAGRAQAQADITLDQAYAVVVAAKAKAEELNTKMDIAVVDAGANLKAFARMDGAWLGSIDIAIKKAKTARFFDMNTGEIGKLSQPGGPLYNIEHSNGGLITFPGGVVLKNAAGEIVGAIGVSGSSVENDHAVAEAGAVALGGAAAAAPGKSDDDLVKETVGALKAALEAKNIDALLATFSDSFENPQVGSKEEAKAMLQLGLDSGYADDGEVSIEDMEIEYKDGLAIVYPIDLSSPAGAVAVELTMKKEGDKFLIVALDVDGL